MFLVISPNSIIQVSNLNDALDAVVDAQDNSTSVIYLVDIKQEQTYAYHYNERLNDYADAVTISHSQF